MGRDADAALGGGMVHDNRSRQNNRQACYLRSMSRYWRDSQIARW